MEKIRFVGGPCDDRVMEVEVGIQSITVPLDKPKATIPDRVAPSPVFESVEYIRRRLADTGEEVFVWAGA